MSHGAVPARKARDSAGAGRQGVQLVAVDDGDSRRVCDQIVTTPSFAGAADDTAAARPPLGAGLRAGLIWATQKPCRYPSATVTQSLLDPDVVTVAWAGTLSSASSAHDDLAIASSRRAPVGLGPQAFRILATQLAGAVFQGTHPD